MSETPPKYETGAERITELASVPDLIKFLRLESVRNAIEPLLIEGQKYERIVREIANAAADNNDIFKCSVDSIVRAVTKAISYDLMIGDGVFLVPRKDRSADAKPKLRAQIGYRGKIELMLRYRAAKFIDYHCRYANEHYRCEYGSNAFIEHRPIMDPEKRGELVGAYAFAKVTQFDIIPVEMHRSEIDAIRAKYSQAWKTETVWENNQKVVKPIALDAIPWYCEARVVHRLGKKVPMRGQLASILASDHGDEDDLESIEAPAIARRELGVGAAEPIKPAERVAEEVAL